MINQDKNVQSEPLQTSEENPQLFNSPDMGGPQFGLENQDSEKNGFRNWISRYGSSVILPIIALVILAGGIYLYTNQKSEQASLFSDENLATIQEQTPGSEQGLVAGPSDEISQIPGQSNGEALIEKIIPEGRKQGGMIIEKAAIGDGVTNLARRALVDYLKDHPQELTNEHKIYIEDYLKDSIGSKPLEVGEEVTFSEDLIKEAIDASLELTPEQLKNLEQYSALVAW